jgi:thiamine kinase
VLDITELLTSIPALAGVEHHELLNRGVVNETWRVFSGTDSYVLRRDTSMVNALGLDRKAELDVLAIASQAGLGPAVIWSDLDAGLLLTRYTDGVSWGEAEFGDKQNLLRLAKLLKRLHGVPTDSKPLKIVNFAAHASHYAHQLATPEAERFADEVASLVEKWCADSSRHVLCHNDLVSGNIIDVAGNDDLMLIDWEYAGLGEPYFDLAVFLHQYPFSATDARVFLDAYSTQVDEERLAACVAIYERVLVLWLMLVAAGPNGTTGNQAELAALTFRLNQ